MPTSYTSDLYDGKPITFSDFALGCARAFGALVEIRDASPDATIPEEFAPETYHEKARQDAAARLIDLSNMTDDECRVAAEREYVDALREHRKRQRDEAAMRARYEAMLDRVLAWEPPTDDHVGLKRFMVEQIESSIRFDTGYTWPDPVKQTGSEWREANRTAAEHDVEYHDRKYAEDIERATQRTQWVQALRESLTNPSPPEVPAASCDLCGYEGTPPHYCYRPSGDVRPRPARTPHGTRADNV